MIAGIWAAIKAALTALGLIRDLEQARNTPAMKANAISAQDQVARDRINADIANGDLKAVQTDSANAPD